MRDFHCALALLCPRFSPCGQQHHRSNFIYACIQIKWIMAVMLHSVNYNVNNNKMHFIIFVHGQMSAAAHIKWNEGWSNMTQTMSHWVQRCHREPQLTEQMRSAIMHRHQGIVSFVVRTKTHLTTLTLPQSRTMAIQTEGSFWNATSPLSFAESKSTWLIRIT